jgi:hypothetical protein
MTRTDGSYTRGSWLKMNLQAVAGRALPRVVGSYREPSWIFFETFLPILGIAAYVYIYKSMGAPDYFMGFVILGGYSPPAIVPLIKLLQFNRQNCSLKII